MARRVRRNPTVEKAKRAWAVAEVAGKDGSSRGQRSQAVSEIDGAACYIFVLVLRCSCVGSC